MDAYYLVLLETSGNQPFIFATNKLKENVGASQLIYECGTRYVLEAVKEKGGPDLWDENSATLRDNLADTSQNPHLEKQPWRKIEVITATSGKALLLVKDPNVGRELVQRATTTALRRAPGVDLFGVVSTGFSFEEDPASASLPATMKALHGEHERLCDRLPGSEARFLRVPVIAPCDTSGWPATAVAKTKERQTVGRGDVVFQASGTRSKRRAAPAGWNRFNTLLKDRLMDLDALQDHFESSGRTPWAAVIHSDGNNLGRLFSDFHHWVVSGDEGFTRSYLTQLQHFSLALEECGEIAFREALLECIPGTGEEKLPVVPLVVGGDDLTVYCDGALALPLAEAYLRCFERETGRADGPRNGIVARVARSASTRSCLTACAGVAIVKPHFPFHAAYDLSNDLLASAKSVKQKVNDSQGRFCPCSALDFHVLYDVSDARLARIRTGLRVDPSFENGQLRYKTWLYGHPYVVTSGSDLRGLAGQSDLWRRSHDWKSLKEQAKTIRNSTANREAGGLPKTVLHELRESLFQGRAEADAWLDLLLKRYPALERLARDSKTLFWPDKDDEGNNIDRTSFLDAMDVAAFYW